MSTFHGLEMAKQALFAQQSALYTTGHNIANANTEGYSRQRVNFEADQAMPSASRNRSGMPGQIGTGVKAGSIQRIRDHFIDHQFRGENSLAGYWEKRAEALGRMENVLNDLDDTGLSEAMDQFWSGLQDLAVNPTNGGARSVVVHRGIALSDTFNYLNQSLTQIRNDLKTEMNHSVENVNRISEQVNELNTEIKALEIAGYIPNDLYDQRDLLIDELSRIIPIDVSYEKSGDHVGDAAQGLAVIEVKTEEYTDADGNTKNGYKLVDGENLTYQSISLAESVREGFSYISGIQLDLDGSPLSLETGREGTLKSLIDAYGSGENKGDFLKGLKDLTDLRNNFIEAFNVVHHEGVPLDETVEPVDFFVIDDNGNMVVNQEIIDNPEWITAALEGEGDGKNALELAKVFDEAGIKEAYAQLTGSLAVQVEDAERMQRNTTVLLSQLEGSRQSIRSVSLDEEMTNMIKFQHAYNAAARSMTATDELLDRIINNMGLVGR
ncbi:flagellar hook-associated protein FlgK [Oceanobacillus alkalisoli]|uniref:flagellar hook-associated protein FlgK n=1 Tax=Oceanobacillus alkalisoli TaxID=2925113 RepID=UPI001F1204AD|nr:flagellar hook-associated protein FlgK [Oceanobacillus alkalisoli]MCF3943441.1 flagellar hook-associated protein FlgK [Oceanobacillus alkalisoli]